MTVRIEVGKHPAAIHITDVCVNGVPLIRGTCVWVDLARSEACIYKTGADGKWLLENGQPIEHIIRGRITVRIPEDRKHLLEWGSGT